MLYSTAASTGGPESNLSTIIFRSGFSEVTFFASAGKVLTISLYEVDIYTPWAKLLAPKAESPPITL